MKTVKVLLTCAISLAMVFCFCGTAFATEPINTKADLAAQKTEYVTATGQTVISTDIEVQGYIVPQKTTTVERPKPTSSDRIPQTGDSGLSQRSLTLALIFGTAAAALSSVCWRLKDRGDNATFGTGNEKT
ncbi:MAG: hypothetical protein FWC54_00770 [Actinomycetia bacterium]|nr:hypothetical protein [Actinomycetes bacterium]